LSEVVVQWWTRDSPGAAQQPLNVLIAGKEIPIALAEDQDTFLLGLWLSIELWEWKRLLILCISPKQLSLLMGSLFMGVGLRGEKG
jgi:hypothetical protein